MHVNRIKFGITEIPQFCIIQKSLSDLNLILAAQDLTTTRNKEIEETIKSKALAIFGSNMATTGKISTSNGVILFRSILQERCVF